MTASLCTNPIIPPALCEYPQEAGGFLFPVCQHIENIQAQAVRAAA